MRESLPITNREFDFPADATLMSTTDAQGRITYANDAFVEVSGFCREEIDGHPHNIVRSLAQRSADTAKAIKVLIGNSVEKVDEGVKLVDEAGDTMNDIVTKVKRVSSMISQIAVSTSEQSDGIAQVWPPPSWPQPPLRLLRQRSGSRFASGTRPTASTCLQVQEIRSYEHTPATTDLWSRSCRA